MGQTYSVSTEELQLLHPDTNIQKYSVLTEEDTADADQTEGLAGVTMRKSGWIVKQILRSWSGADVTVVDDQKIPVCNVTGKALSLRNGMFFFNPRTNGNKPVAYMQVKLLAWRPTWKLFTFRPNFEGQESTYKVKIEQHSEVPIYQYAIMDAKISSLLGEMRFKRYVTNEETEDVWEAKVKNQFDYVDITESNTKEVVAQLEQTSVYQVGAEFALEAAKGVDRLSLTAFAIACGKMMEG